MNRPHNPSSPPSVRTPLIQASNITEEPEIRQLQEMLIRDRYRVEGEREREMLVW